MIYDSHCHLDLMDNMTPIVQSIAKEDVGMLSVGTTPRAYLKEVEIFGDVRNIHIALGLHPQLVGSGYDDWRLFEELAKHCHYIGEVGLDFGKNYIANKNQQIEIFEKVLFCCEQYGDKVVSIHSLRAASTILDILGGIKKCQQNTYILHWFTGSLHQMKIALELGCFFSINPKMLKTKSGIDLIQNIPPQRILLETDAPFSANFKNIEQLNTILQRLINDISILKKVDIGKYITYNEKTIFKYI